MRILVTISLCIVAILFDAYAFQSRHDEAVWREAQSLASQVNSRIDYWVSKLGPAPAKGTEHQAAYAPQKL